jgi:cobyrinic acid a,c-diamide synthase
MSPKGLIIAAPRSGGGKTTVTLGLLTALRRRGLHVASAKSGPDYIDPAFHSAATGAPSVNLDSWAMAPAMIDDLAWRAAQDADVLVVESSMGLFDGVAGAPGRTGAGADLAERLGLPVLLVLDVSGQFQTAAATARGFFGFRPGVAIGGVVLNRLASPRHRDGVVAALAEANIPVLGEVARDETLTLPERHLGLVQASEQADLQARLARLGDLAERSLDLDAIVAMAQPISAPAPTAAAVGLPPPGQRIALASDEAFSFSYSHLRDGWRRAGAEIALFSPLADEPPPESCDSCWLPGGYPELHAPRLAAAARFRDGLAAFAKTRPVHGECGGYMVLGQGLETADGELYAMAGLLGHTTSFARRRMNLGYRSATLLQACPLGPRGAVIRGHEFHYSQMIERGADAALADLNDAAGRALGATGGRRGFVSGAYFHAIAPLVSELVS